MSKIPVYKRGKQAGYDKSSRRYRDIEGNIVHKSNILAASRKIDYSEFGFSVSLNRTPVSDAMEKYDQIVRGGEKLEALITYEDRRGKKTPTAQPIPADIRAALSLTEFYTRTEGDVFQHIEAPIDVAINDIDIDCPDEGVKQELQDLYSVDGLDMQSVLYQIWLSAATFGQAAPLEVFNDDRTPNGVVLLPPRYLWIGYFINFSDIIPRGSQSPFALKPLDGSDLWTEELIKNTIMPITYNSFSPNWNEQTTAGYGIPLDPDYLRIVRAKSFAYNRYAWPPISRAFRAISTRTVFEEMVRATIEGYRNQLWLFLLGDAKNPPDPAEVKALKAVLSGMSGERTGELVWTGNLAVTQESPKPLEQMLSNDTWQAFTLQIFRQLGSNIRIVTGNPMLSGRGDTQLDIDLSIWLKRLEFPRLQTLKWENHFRGNLAKKKNSPAWTKANEATTVRFSKSLLEVGSLIKEELHPLYQIGLLSPQTALKRAGYDFKAEIKNKQAAQKYSDLLEPRSTFAQTTVNPSTPEKLAKSAPAGRPADNLNPNKLKAAWEDNEKRKVYFAAVYAALQNLWEDRNSEAFISALKALNSEYLKEITLDSYHRTGGVGEMPDDWADLSANFVNSFAGGFQKYIEDKISESRGADLTDEFLHRTMLYPQEGYKMAILNGQAYAMRERGARGWRRVLHPELSRTGPCPMCEADSLVVHGMDEPFQVMHPHEVCGMQELYIQYYTDGGIPSIEVPIPTAPNDMRDYLQSLGELGKSITRRKRLA